ncbi:MAG: tetraacyldisaccharide 4'-kinase [Flavobacteriaceae bacterium]|nr:MAG: tetraacyldisaccharide 4'-kinase [Flavobacteriaceae bacterium]
MRFIRKLAFPFSILYGFIISIRNLLFDKEILKSTHFDIPVIAVGNLSVGGTGKTPQIEYLIRLLKDSKKIAVLSRGYKRKTSGFVLADTSSSANKIGDEPFQYYQKFKDIKVAVDEKRVHGIEQLLATNNPPEVVLLDDAYQHRKVKAGFYILLTAYGDLYSDDYILPTGNLREPKSGADRAQVIIVTKCPDNLSENEQQKIRQKLKLSDGQELFFTCIAYDDIVSDGKREITLDQLKGHEVLLVTGIANPKPLENFLKSNGISFEHIEFPDHHDFSKADVDKIKNAFGAMHSEKKLILTTEKDFVRLKDDLQISHLKIKTKFINRQNDFDTILKAYVEQSSRNR